MEGGEGVSVLDTLLARFSFVMITRFCDYPDGEGDDAPADVAISVTDYTGRQKRAVRATALEAVEAVMGQERRFWCNGPCGEQKKSTEFSRDAGRPTGRVQRCKVCERARVRAYARRKKGWRCGDESLPPLPRTHREPLRDQPVVILEFQPGQKDPG